MMTVVFERPEKCLYSAGGYFDFVNETEWMDDIRVREMIKDIDKTDVLTRAACYSPILGSIGARDLSGGVKGLILILKDKDYRAYSSCIFGDNCSDWICKLSTMVDFTFYYEHCFVFARGETYESPNIMDKPLLAKAPDGTIVRTSGEMMYKLSELGWGLSS